MEEKNMQIELMQLLAEQEAWNMLSEELSWSEVMLEKWKDKLDWDTISQNENIVWTIPMMRKFQDRINWSIFSSYADKQILTADCIDEFKDLWDWEKLSINHSFPVTDDVLEKYADRIHWESIYDCTRYRDIDNLWANDAIGFYKRYQQYIPVCKLQGTTLLYAIAEQMSKGLREKIIEG